jgi:hypothetical protein
MTKMNYQELKKELQGFYVSENKNTTRKKINFVTKDLKEIEYQLEGKINAMQRDGYFGGTKPTYTEIQELKLDKLVFVNELSRLHGLKDLLKPEKVAELKELFEENYDGIMEMIISDELKLSTIIEGMQEYGLTHDNIIDKDFEEYEGSIYNDDEYKVTHDGEILHCESVAYCEYYEGYFDEEDIQQVHIANNARLYSTKAIEHCGLHEYDGEFYDDEALSYSDLVLDFQGSVRHSDDVYYHESDGEYYDYPEEEDEEYTRSYHSGETYFKDFDNENNKTKYKIGFEIEKEDSDVLRGINIDDFEENCPKWKKEHDGSLNDNGYELVSPAMTFNTKKIFEYIKENETLIEHINGSFSTRCGGHINLSHSDMNGNDLFDSLKGYTPLLYALYSGRVNRDYSRGKNNEDLKNDGDKKQAIRIGRDRIEFRIFSAVRDVVNLEWRCKLIELMTKHPTHDVKIAYYNVITKFMPHIRKVYDAAKIQTFKQRIVDYSLRFEDIDPTK